MPSRVCAVFTSITLAPTETPEDIRESVAVVDHHRFVYSLMLSGVSAGAINHCFSTDLVGHSTWFRSFRSGFGLYFVRSPNVFPILLITKWTF